jgi:calcineurin-like phosphoesterase family protein
MIFFTSDTHFGHQNILKYCLRPYSSIEEMQEALITNWNSRVSNDDTVYHLGDFSFHERYVESIVPRLNGTKILLLGNHDKPHPANKGKTPKKFETWRSLYLQYGFSEVVVETTIEINGTLFRLNHLPSVDNEDFYQGQTVIRYLNHRPKDDMHQICGHVHERWLTSTTKNGNIMVNVGVDAPNAPWYMRPATSEEVFNVFNEALLCKK